PRSGVQNEFRDLEVRIRFHAAEVTKRIFDVEIVFAKRASGPVGKRDPEKPSARRRKGNRVFFPSVVGNVDDFAERLTIVAYFNVSNRWSRSEHIRSCCARVV